MSSFVEGIDRNQVTLFPKRLESWTSGDYLVRDIIRRFCGRSSSKGIWTAFSPAEVVRVIGFEVSGA